MMPSLVSKNMAGLTSGDISGFSDSVLNVNLAGQAMLEGRNLSFDFLMVNAAGINSILIEEVSPLPAADLHLAGFSSATVNIMVNTVLTGGVEGMSTLSYYGNKLTIGVFIEDDGSSVRRSGDSRP